MTYKIIENVSRETLEKIKSALKDSVWKKKQGQETNYEVCFVEFDLPEIKQILGGEWTKMFFLKLPRKGKIHKHIDTPRLEETYHIPIETNDLCINYMEDEPYHLEVGKIYWVDRSREHHSVNLGDSDRVHLLIEVADGKNREHT